eukprot:s1105_g8.t2
MRFLSQGDVAGSSLGMVSQLCSSNVEGTASFLGGTSSKAQIGPETRRLLASFFSDADLAPPGGLPPPNGWGEGNDSPCQTCACTEDHGNGGAEEPEVGADIYTKMVFPNVPHHSFYPHRRGYKINHLRIYALFFAGLGCGYAAASSATHKEKQWALPGLNREFQIAVGTAGSQWALPDLNREHQIPVGTAGPQPRAPDCSGHCQT